MTIHLSRNKLLCAVILWEYLFLVLSAMQAGSSWALTTFGLLTLLILPGFLTVLALGIEDLPLWAHMAIIIGISLLELVVVALVGNYVLPHFGIVRPLDRPVLLAEFAVIVPLILLVNLLLKRELTLTLNRFALFDSGRDAVIALIPALFVLMAVGGAMRLNNGSGGTLTLLMLIGMACYCAFIIWPSDRLGKNVLPTAIFFMSLALLLMTSLRGWYTTGHDIQREFGVFQLTKTNGLWNIAGYREAYNACMSITILPTLFSNLLRISDVYIYKVIFQILFAIVPTLLFITLRRFATASVAFISVLYFVSFPTFFGDMPFLNRQEMAFLYFGLMLYLAFSESISLRMRHVLFVLFGLGMVLSHYSTTYTVVALLIALLCIRPLARMIGTRLARSERFRDSGFAFLKTGVSAKPFITVWVVVVLALASFLWSSVLTNTASASFSRVISETLAVMRDTVRNDLRSNDVSYSLFSKHKIDLPALYADYQERVVAPLRAENPAWYYSTSTYMKYPASLVLNTRMPLTKVGTVVEEGGVPVAKINDTFRDVSAKFLQILILVGLVGGLVRQKFLKQPLDTDFVLLTVASLFFVIAQVVLPVLSVEYGVLRAFQQALFFFGICIVGGCFFILDRASSSIKIVASGGLAILFLLSSTGAITQTLGGYGAQMHLNNSGVYYDQYYLHRGEMLATEWLKEKGIGADHVQAFAPLSDQFDLYFADIKGIYPGLVRKDSYLILNDSVVARGIAGISYKASEFSYSYPIEFLDENKDLIFSTKTAEIYR